MFHTDIRQTWDAREPEIDRIEAERAHYLQIARDLGDDDSIALASSALAELRNCRQEFRRVRAPLDEAMVAKAAAEVALGEARFAEQVGTPDRARALRDHEDVIAAEAKCRHFANTIPALLASADGAQTRVTHASHLSIGRDVVEETRAFVKNLFEYKRPERVRTEAETAGKRSNVERAAWWRIAEELARREFPSKLPGERDTGVRHPSTGRFVQDPRREERRVPTAADLEQVFAARRAGFANERRRVSAQLQELTGQLQTLGGAQ